MTFIKLILKNFRILFRNKLTSFILIFGPLLIILIAGMAFNNSNTYNIKVGVHSDNLSLTGENFVKDLKEKFIVTTFSSSEECVDSIKSKGFHSCILIPPNLEINDESQNTIDFYFDNSKINIVNSIKQDIFKSIGKTSKNISEDIATKLINSIEFAEKEITVNKEKLNSEIENLDKTKEDSSNSKNLLENNNLEFDQSELGLNDLEDTSDNIKKDYDDLKKLSDDILNEFTDFSKEMDDLTNQSSLQNKIDTALDLVSNFDDELNNQSNNISNSDKLISIVSDITTQITDLDSNLKTAKNNNNQVSNKLDSIKDNLEKSKSTLENIKESSTSILNKFNENSIRDSDKITSPVLLKEHRIVTGSNLNYLYPNLMILVIMFVTIIISSTQVINEKLNRAKNRMSMTPTSFLVNSLSTFFTIIIITIMQFSLVLILTQFFFKVDILNSLFPITIILLFTAIFFTLTGIAIGYIFNSQHTVVFGAISVSSFFFILSDLILPLESMPANVIKYMNVTPFIIATDLLRKTMFFQMNLNQIQSKLWVFAGLSIIILLSIILVSSISNLITKLKAKRIAKKISQ